MISLKPGSNHFKLKDKIKGREQVYLKVTRTPMRLKLADEQTYVKEMKEVRMKLKREFGARKEEQSISERE